MILIIVISGILLTIIKGWEAVEGWIFSQINKYIDTGFRVAIIMKHKILITSPLLKACAKKQAAV